MQIDPQTIAKTLQLGSQYAIPAAATLRALYSGYKGNLPGGLTQIAGASLLAGVTAIASNKTPDLASAIKLVAGNTVLLTGLLGFVVVYLVQTRLRAWLDAAVGGSVGFVLGWLWIYFFGHPWPWWSIALVAVAGALVTIILHSAMRQILTLLRLATAFLIIGVLFMVGAGGLYLLNQQHLINVPIPGIK